eukprot:COSAG01_NODE_23458_length_814_cov_2.162238_1_plen_175_part_10
MLKKAAHLIGIIGSVLSLPPCTSHRAPREGTPPPTTDSDWAAKVKRQDAIYAPGTDAALSWRQVPDLANGMVGTAPGSPHIFLQGVVSNSSRAWVNSSLPSARLSASSMVMSGALLDLREGTYLRRYRAATGCPFSLEQRFFAHRSRPSLFVMEVQVAIPCGCAWGGEALNVTVT